MQPQKFRCNRFASRKNIELIQIDDGVGDAKKIVKPPLGHTAMQGHLAAFESATAGIAATRFLAFVSGAGGFAQLRTDTAAYADLAMARTLWGAQVRQTDWRASTGGRAIGSASRLRRGFSGCVFLFCFFLFGHNLFHHFHEMPYFEDHAANRGRILMFNNLMQSAQPQAANGLPHIARARYEAGYPLDLDGAAFLFFSAHALSPAATFAGFPRISSTVLERISAIWAMSFKLNSAAKVALITLCGFEVPRDFVSTL